MNKKSSNKHVNIPIFVVHMGCPNQCVFCDQRLISGTPSFSEELARCQIETVLSGLSETVLETEIAFFGGSFTGIDRALMIRLLDMAEAYVTSGRVSGIRLSTRPDYITREILDILSKYTIRSVELGIQSISDEVLRISKRGHNSTAAERAVLLLSKYGLPFVGQMMIGLPGASIDDEVRTAEFIADSGAVGYRVYPTIVFKGTELSAMTENGTYTPLTIDDAVARMVRVMDVFDRHDICCLRAGLCESPNLHNEFSYMAGPNHPAIGELAKSALMYARIEENLLRFGSETQGASIAIEVAKGYASTAAGQHRANIQKLMENYGVKSVKILENGDLLGYNNKIGILIRKK